MHQTNKAGQHSVPADTQPIIPWECGVVYPILTTHSNLPPNQVAIINQNVPDFKQHISIGYWELCAANACSNPYDGGPVCAETMR